MCVCTLHPLYFDVGRKLSSSPPYPPLWARVGEGKEGRIGEGREGRVVSQFFPQEKGVWLHETNGE